MLGNIVTDEIFNIDKTFNVVKSKNDKIKNLPTLVIGYDKICGIYDKSKINVLNRTIGEDVFWTFKKNVKRKLYENDLENFIRYCYQTLINKYNIIPLDIIQLSLIKRKKILIELYKQSNYISYESRNNIIYILINKLIFIIDLNQLEYFNFNLVKIKNKIKEKSKVYLNNSNILPKYTHYLEKINNDIKYLPLLYLVHNY